VCWVTVVKAGAASAVVGDFWRGILKEAVVQGIAAASAQLQQRQLSARPWECSASTGVQVVLGAGISCSG
jgi:hypothetical protein